MPSGIEMRLVKHGRGDTVRIPGAGRRACAHFGANAKAGEMDRYAN